SITYNRVGHKRFDDLQIGLCLEMISVPVQCPNADWESRLLVYAIEPTGITVIETAPISPILPRHQLISRIASLALRRDTVSAMELLVSYAGASHFLLAREDQLKEAGLNFVVSSDWLAKIDCIMPVSLSLCRQIGHLILFDAFPTICLITTLGSAKWRSVFLS